MTIYLDRFNLFSKTFKEQIVKLLIYIYQKRVNYDVTEFIIAQNLNRQKAFVSVYWIMYKSKYKVFCDYFFFERPLARFIYVILNYTYNICNLTEHENDVEYQSHK